MFVERILRLLAGLLVGIWVARYLGPSQFGIFSYAVAFVSIFSSFAKLGLDSILVRNLTNEPANRDAYMGTAFWLKLIGAIAMLAVIGVTIQFSTSDSTTKLFVLIIASGGIFQAFEVVDFYFQSQVLSKFVSICKMTQLLISSLAKLYLMFIGADLFWFVLVSLVDQATLAISLYFAYRYQRIGQFFRSFDWAIAKNLLKDSWPLILASFVLMIQARVDQVMLKEMVSDTELGYYSSAIKIIEIFNFIPMAITTSLFPAIVNAKKTSKELYIFRLEWLYRAMMFLFLIVAIPIFFFGTQVIVFLYKDAYAPAGMLFSLMGLRLFFANYGVVRSAYLINENLIKYSFITMLAGMVVNILFNCYLIPIYHSKGAIYSSIISFFVTTFLIDLIYSKTRFNAILMIKSFFFMKLSGTK
jgi:O-antigen/teichoic acid export membrane protein